jgi:hypothetical protein
MCRLLLLVAPTLRSSSRCAMISVIFSSVSFTGRRSGNLGSSHLAGRQAEGTAWAGSANEVATTR